MKLIRCTDPNQARRAVVLPSVADSNALLPPPATESDADPSSSARFALADASLFS